MGKHDILRPGPARAQRGAPDREEIEQSRRHAAAVHAQVQASSNSREEAADDK